MKPTIFLSSNALLANHTHHWLELLQISGWRESRNYIRLFITPILGLKGRGRSQTVNCQLSTVNCQLSTITPSKIRFAITLKVQIS
ncbi:MAG: hypothetical protein JGK29_15680 [Microcoleus sp. PH2017_17_BER_D_A]|nr:hypothetical protein [Microcoleus sp. PH2017_17_BER_D_A]